MKLPLTYYGDPILRKKCSPVIEIDDDIKTLVADMIETMESSNGIGIAAPQVGRSLRIFITHVSYENDDGELIEKPLKIFINPEILDFSIDKSIMSEGCLSIPKLHGDVTRPSTVKIKATDLENREFIEEFQGLDAHCVLHENDHINGVLFIDRMDKKERKEIEKKLRQVKQDYYDKK